jgi:hypothetical protein
MDACLASFLKADKATFMSTLMPPPPARAIAIAIAIAKAVWRALGCGQRVLVTGADSKITPFYHACCRDSS